MPQLAPNYGVLERASRTPLPHTSSASRLPKASAPPSSCKLSPLQDPGRTTQIKVLLQRPGQHSGGDAFGPSHSAPHIHTPPKSATARGSRVRGFPSRGRPVSDESTHAPAPETWPRTFHGGASPEQSFSPTPSQSRPHAHRHTHSLPPLALREALTLGSQ